MIIEKKLTAKIMMTMMLTDVEADQAENEDNKVMKK
jgi:hypothetical protein